MENYVFKDGLAVPYVASRQNPRVAAASKLAEKKYREKSRAFLCEGLKLTLEAAKWGSLLEVYVRESTAESFREVYDIALSVKAGYYVLSDSAFDKITTEKSPQGIISMAACEKPFLEAKEDGVVLLLDSIRDPGNLGTIIRSACAFGGVRVVLHSCADLYNPKTVRAAMGAIFKVDVSVTSDAVRFVRDSIRKGRRVLAAALTDDSLKLGAYEPLPTDVIVIGNEGHGVSANIIEECSAAVLIPMEENTESLNAAVAASVFLWEYARGTK